MGEGSVVYGCCVVVPRVLVQVAGAGGAGAGRTAAGGCIVPIKLVGLGRRKTTRTVCLAGGPRSTPTRARAESTGRRGACLVRGWLGSGFGGVPFGSLGTFSPGVAPVLAGGGLWAAVRYWCALACQRRDSAQASCSITRLSLPSPLPVATPRHLHLLARVALALSSRCMCKQGSGIIATTAWAWRRRPGGERAS